MQRFIEKLDKEEFPITYEVPSPRGGNVDKYIKIIADLPFLDALAGLNVCNNPVGKVRIDPGPFSGRILHELDVEPIAHLTCRDTTLSGLQKWLLGADSMGIRNLLAMTGDYAVGDYPAEEKIDTINSLELITGIKKYLNNGQLMPELSTRQSRQRNRYLTELETLEKPTEFNVGGVMLPRRTGETTYASNKIQAGVDFFQTQITYDAYEVIELLTELEDMNDRYPPVLVSTAPFASPEEMTFLSENVPQVNIPQEVQERLSSAKNFSEESVIFAVEMYTDILDYAKEAGLHTKLGAHIIPMRSEKMAAKIVEEIIKL